MKKLKLSATDLEDQKFNLIDFSKTSLASHSFSQCVFDHCDFTESSWLNARFWACTFRHCNISLVKLKGCQLQDVSFIECKIVGAEFFSCDTTLFFSINITKSFVQYGNFSDLDMKKTMLQGSTIHLSMFINTNLVQTNFTHTDLQGTTFHNCDLTENSRLPIQINEKIVVSMHGKRLIPS